ncbi:hypothetical protein ACFWJM_25145 [Streptomyces sp. NPDC127077]|uniref:hypothetical protein n=1 Tax=Streptomyces sp. NPDC127077 TaxID=3347131 RepID=UPI003649FCD6
MGDGTGSIPVRTPPIRDGALNEQLQQVGSALFATPPGVRDRNEWWGRALFS